MTLTESFDNSDSDTLVVHIQRRKASDPLVTSVELLHADIRNRYSFKNGRPLEKVFTDKLAGALDTAIKRVAPGERVVSMPEFEVTLPDLALAGLRILLSKADDGVEVIMLRFRQYIGAIKSAFLFDPAMPIDSPTMRERVAVEVLRDIVNPIFDIMSLVRNAPESVIDENCSAVKSQLRKISTRQEEISFFTGLLQRYIAGCRSDAEQSRVIDNPQSAEIYQIGSDEPPR